MFGSFIVQIQQQHICENNASVNGEPSTGNWILFIHRIDLEQRIQF